ncbi:RNA polymerase sigma-70 factor [Dongia sedimenti]|uniref:RNA polymerase sigma-70 factor n=1 Tax=Dongia sedimenti TaxID=3064282 RepID=A0ABU0YSC4_9PROT|nr:RNA polymerase sigma-70 factor [Rhodospirillaceae bacterium R-7]
MADTDSVHVHRSVLQAIAYRMLGSMAEAEDAVQETFLRWHRQDQAQQLSEIREPKAWLITTLTRHCIDRLRAAKAQRESYVGMWLPEPVVEEPAVEPVDRLELAETLSMALLMLLERLSPDERAAFLLHEVFETDYPDVARILGKTEAACRQLVHRAKERVKAGKPRFTPSRAEQEKVMEGFKRAVASGDVAGLAASFSSDATLYSDGGGKAAATLNPIFGAEKIARFFIGVRDKQPEGARIEPRIVNGSLGYVVTLGERVLQASHFEFDGDRITAVHIVRNPDKLKHLM